MHGAFRCCCIGLYAYCKRLGNGGAWTISKPSALYTDTTFSDVSGWYAGYVETCYELGLFSGTGTGRFSPDASMTAAEAVKLAACLHSIYETGSADFVQRQSLVAGIC